MYNCKPFLKWVGGKTQLLDEISKFYPNDFDVYCEPFLGGGAVLFDILNKFPNIKNIYVNDINKELINTYKVIKSSPKKLIQILEKYQDEYKDKEKRDDIYYQKRDKFNDLPLNKDTKIEKAALFIFLNKTCFNGLYRVNKSGKFNVPKGSYSNPLICDKENILSCSKALKKVKFFVGSYKNLKKFASSKTLYFIDPPYRPITNNSFTAYSTDSFSDKSQIELKNFIDDISNLNSKFILSNSDPKNTDKNDNFFDDLYKNYSITRVDATRMINSDASKRANIKEIIISN